MAGSPTEVVRAFMAAMEKMDFDAGVKFVAPDCEYTNGPMGTQTGPEGVRAALGPFFAPIAENEFIIHRTAENGPVVFMERLDRHRIGETWITLPVNSVFEVRDGQIKVWHEYFDAGTIQTQLAALGG